MKKENYRDYVCSAYRYYAQCGCPDYEEIRRLRLEAQNSKAKAAVSDLEAVARTLEHIRMLPDGEIMENCLRDVYFSVRYPKRGDISADVCAASKKYYLNETAVYRILNRCRVITASFRGLRVENFAINDYI